MIPKALDSRGATPRVSSPGKPADVPYRATGSETRRLTLGPRRLRPGGFVEQMEIAYELSGPADAPVVVALGGISAGRHVTAHPDDPSPGWWQGLIGPGAAIDPGRRRVLSFDYVGGNGDSTGPRNHATLPPLTPADQADVLASLIDHLDLPAVHLLGASYGGMVGLAFAAEHGTRLRRLTVISAAHRGHTQATALRSLQRRIVRLGAAQGDTREGMVLARALAMTTYRTPQELEARFAGPPHDADGRPRFAVEDYLRARGEAFADTFHPDAFLTLSESIDLHRIDPRRINAPTVLIAVPDDRLIPIAHVRDLAAQLGGPHRLFEINSPFGHDAFLKEIDTIGAILRQRHPWSHA